MRIDERGGGIHPSPVRCSRSLPSNIWSVLFRNHHRYRVSWVLPRRSINSRHPVHLFGSTFCSNNSSRVEASEEILPPTQRAIQSGAHSVLGGSKVRSSERRVLYQSRIRSDQRSAAIRLQPASQVSQGEGVKRSSVSEHRPKEKNCCHCSRADGPLITWIYTVLQILQSLSTTRGECRWWVVCSVAEPLLGSLASG